MPNEMVFNQGLLHLAFTAANFNAIWTMRLFSNNRVPVAGDTMANYTEATFTGYAPLFVANAVLSFDAGTLIETVTWDQLTFECTANISPEILYGWLLEADGDPVGGPRIVTGGNFNPPQAMVNNGDQIKLTPIMRFKKGTL